jgi:hypothetical protein
VLEFNEARWRHTSFDSVDGIYKFILLGCGGSARDGNISFVETA